MPLLDKNGNGGCWLPNMYLCDGVWIDKKYVKLRNGYAYIPEMNIEDARVSPTEIFLKKIKM